MVKVINEKHTAGVLGVILLSLPPNKLGEESTVVRDFYCTSQRRLPLSLQFYL